MFFKAIVLEGPLGKTNYCTITLEFKFRVNQHMHCFTWILNTPESTLWTILEYRKWLDSIIHTDLLNPNSEYQLHGLVKKHQIHRHSKTCPKFKNSKHTFHVGRLHPWPDNLTFDIKSKIMKNRKRMCGERRQKGPPTSFSPVTSTNAGIRSEDYLTFIFNLFDRLV